LLVSIVVSWTKGTLESDGSKFDSSRDRGKAFKFTIGQGMVIKGWDQGFASMKVGEQAILKIRSDYGYGDGGSGAKIPPKATLLFDVELLGFSEKLKERW
jgi:FKBP-type peptidyl-prolyl cis-trans isomerase